MYYFLKSIAFLLMLSISSNAQTPINLTSSDLNNLFLKELESDALKNGKNELVEVNGSIFLYDDFRKAEVITSKGAFESIQVRYNIREDVFQFKMRTQILLLDPAPIVKRISIDKEVFVVKSFVFQGKEKTGFVKALVEGKYGLYAKKNLTFRPAKPPRALESEPTPAQYTQPDDTYYLEMLDGKMERIKNGKDVVFLAQNIAFEKQLKVAKISLKKASSLQEVVFVLNSL